jgi:glucose-6-phosphate 1-dehydrogenase
MNTGPTIFVIFGVTGDLSQKKLIPALFSLFKNGLLPKQFKIVGFSRRNWSDNDLKDFITSIMLDKGNHTLFKDFLSHIEYSEGTFDDPEAYQKLKAHLEKIDDQFGICTNKLLYLAVSPNFYEVIFNELANSGLSIPCGGDLGWTRVLVEKPFGRDTETAAKLEKQLCKIFKEEQIFRIDHYLAKETVQNILAFRFANAMFEPLWNSKSIERVEIKLFEKNGLENRGDFYDGVGALRDVGQNHILQMLALVAMDRPKDFSASHIRKERASILKKLSLGKNSTKGMIRGQYQGFTEEKGVSKNSITETYFKMPVFVATSRWKNVPFILESGKALENSKTEISVYFKKLPGTEQNVLKFRIQPNEGIDMKVWLKEPGFANEYAPTTLSFSYSQDELVQELPDAYERVLFDCVRGDQTLFASTDEVSCSWKFITPILDMWQKLPLMLYSKGSHGPLIS